MVAVGGCRVGVAPGGAGAPWGGHAPKPAAKKGTAVGGRDVAEWGDLMVDCRSANKPLASLTLK